MSSNIFRLVKKYLSVNPEFSESCLEFGKFRPPPGSFTQKYEPEAGPADKVSNNYYYTRDVRRDYPRTTFYSQGDVATLLLATPTEAQKTIAGGEVSEATKTPPSLNEALAKIETFSPTNYSQFLPPIPRKRHNYTFSKENYKVDAGVYWPVYLVK
ncbi:hypothetical protein DSO57_1031655 [Entomophthora muscae]|uniref:Uncharacterized protein n=1 Tax=Entomophthora muscae TaxID=34485 RepID=A0ACC2RRM7_9FUNG|nr:hypothetical protein DSO57_1031655 [Entomophthora muscae]